MPAWFTGLKRLPKSKTIVVFDVVSSGKDSHFLCGTIKSSHLCEFHTNAEDMFANLLYYGHEGAMVFSHNAEYDLPVLAGDYFWEGDHVFNSSGLLWGSFRFSKRSVRIYDSRNLFPRYSLQTLASEVGRNQIILSDNTLWLLSDGTLWENFTRSEMEEVRKYSERNTEILYCAIQELQGICNTLGGELRPTIAGCSMDLYRRRYHIFPWEVLDRSSNTISRNAFYGGRVENFAMGSVEPVSMYDTTSLYPFVMSWGKFPHPNHTRLLLSPRTVSEWIDWEGVAECVFETRPEFIPVLPYRHNERLYFPYGRLRGVWPISEIRRAIYEGGSLKSVSWVLGSKIVFNPFNQFVDHLFNYRLIKLSEGSIQANLVKLLLNSLYGRFGLDPGGSLFRVVRIDDDTDFADLQGYESAEMAGYMVAYGPITGLRDPKYINVLFAAQIAALARLTLFNTLKEQGLETVYCDTDSVITRGTVGVGEGLGEWREEFLQGKADLIAPKEYVLHNAIYGDKYVCKGIPESIAREYVVTGAARFVRAVSVRESLGTDKKPSSWIETFRSRNTLIPKRWMVDPKKFSSDGWSLTLPWKTEDLEKLPKVTTKSLPLVSKNQASIYPEESRLIDLLFRQLHQ